MAAAVARSALKLTYFPCRGRGEMLRLSLAASNMAWQDDRPALTTTATGAVQWPQIKASPRSGPLGQLPALHVGGGAGAGGGGYSVAQVLGVNAYLMATVGPEAGNQCDGTQTAPARCACVVCVKGCGGGGGVVVEGRWMGGYRGCGGGVGGWLGGWVVALTAAAMRRRQQRVWWCGWASTC